MPVAAKRSIAPTELTAALRKSPAAAANFRGLPPSHKKQYADWIAQAKQPATRARRAAQAAERLAVGKGHFR